MAEFVNCVKQGMYNQMQAITYAIPAQQDIINLRKEKLSVCPVRKEVLLTKRVAPSALCVALAISPTKRVKLHVKYVQVEKLRTN